MATPPTSEMRACRAGGPLTERQERFARGVAMGLDLAQAYADAGYAVDIAGNNHPTHIKTRAQRVLQNFRVAARVGELRQTAVEPAVRDALALAGATLALDAVERRMHVHRQLERIAELAIVDRRYGEAMDALRMIGSDVGMWGTDKPGAEPAQLARTDAQVMRQAAQIGAAAGAAGAIAQDDIMRRLEQSRRGREAGPSPVRMVDVTPGAPGMAAAAE